MRTLQLLLSYSILFVLYFRVEKNLNVYKMLQTEA